MKFPIDPPAEPLEGTFIFMEAEDEAIRLALFPKLEGIELACTQIGL